MPLTVPTSLFIVKTRQTCLSIIGIVFFAGAVIAGSGFGGAFQGAIRMVLPEAQPHERAGVLSIIYIIAYLAMGLPAVLGGVRFVHGGGVFTTAREYGVAVIVLALVALAGTLLQRVPATILQPSQVRRQ